MLVFIDESGTNNLDQDHIDKLYSVFALGAVIFRNDSYQKFDTDFKRLKLDLFGTDEFVLHTAEITRPSKSKNPLNLKFNDPSFRKRFYSQITQLISAHDLVIAASVVKKKAHFEQFGSNAKDPYIFSFDYLLNSVLTYCKDESCEIFPEKRTHVEDTKLELSYLRTKVTGTEFYKGAEVAEKISNFELQDKRQNVSGLQLADLIVTPIGRHVIGKSPKPVGNEIPFELIKKKMADKDFYVFPQ